MCIVADNIKNVSKTKIASFHVAYTLDGGRTIIPAQLVVYSANVDSNTQSNAFILPVYNPGNDFRKIIPLDFSKMPNFFIDLKNIYDAWFPQSTPNADSLYLQSGHTNNCDLLEVHKVGDYKFSIMPSKIDFNRLDRSQLNISPAAKIAIDMHSDDYSFIIYQFFQRGQIEITPFGYLCEPYKECEMIVPTIHGHAIDNTPTVGFGYIPNMYVSYKSDFEDTAEYDHEIYTLVKKKILQNTINKENVTKKENVIDIDRLLRNITTDYMNRKLRIYVPKSFVPNKIIINGYNNNRNLLIKTDGYTFIRDLFIDKTNN